MIEEGLKVSFLGDTSDLEASSKKAGDVVEKAHQKMGAAAYQARYAVIDLGHTIRDLPYALNNPAMLVGPFDRMQEALMQLKMQTGSTGGAMESLTGVLKGGGGLMIAFDLTVTAVSLFAAKLMESSDVTKDSKTTQEAAALALDKYKTAAAAATTEIDNLKNSIDFLNKISRINLQILINGNTPDGKHKIQLWDLEGQSISAGDMISELVDKEKEAYNQQSKAYEEMLNHMRESTHDAMSNGNENLVGIDLNETEKTYLNLYNQTREGLAKIRKQLEDARNNQRIIYRQIALDKVEATREKPEKQEFNFFDHFFDADPKTASDKAKQTVQMYKVAMEFALSSSSVFEGLDKILTAGSKEGAIEAGMKWWEDAQSGIIKIKHQVPKDFWKMVPKEVAEEDGSKYWEAFSDTFKELEQKQGGFVIGLPKNPNEYEKKLDEYIKKFDAKGLTLILGTFKTDPKSLAALDAQLKKFETLKDIIEKSINPAIESMFAAILAGKNPMQSFFQSLGQSIQQLLSKLLAAAAEAAILSAISGGSFNKVFGSISGLGNIMGFAEGGVVSGATMAMVGEGNRTSMSNPEVIAPLNKLKGIIGHGGGDSVLVGRIRGNDLEILKIRTDKKNKRTA